jgi:hypothetical protein
MAKTPSHIEMFALTVRLPVRDQGWITQQSKEDGTANNVIRQLVEDARTFYSLPDNIRQKLDSDAARLGKTRREYVIHLLSLRYEQLLKEELQEGEKPPARGKR